MKTHRAKSILFIGLVYPRTDFTAGRTKEQWLISGSLRSAQEIVFFPSDDPPRTRKLMMKLRKDRFLSSTLKDEFAQMTYK